MSNQFPFKTVYQPDLWIPDNSDARPGQVYVQTISVVVLEGMFVAGTDVVGEVNNVQLMDAVQEEVVHVQIIEHVVPSAQGACPADVNDE